MRRKMAIALVLACSVVLFGCSVTVNTQPADDADSESATESKDSGSADDTEVSQNDADSAETKKTDSAKAKGVDTVEVDYGKSEIYSKEDLEAAAQLVKDEFSNWEGCELYSLRYAGDESNNVENLKWMNELGHVEEFTEVCEFLSDFHSPVEGGDAWEADTDYNDYQWWLAREEGGEWKLMTWGY